MSGVCAREIFSRVGHGVNFLQQKCEGECPGLIFLRAMCREISDKGKVQWGANVQGLFQGVNFSWEKCVGGLYRGIVWDGYPDFHARLQISIG